MTVPNRLSSEQIRQFHDPTMTALIAFRMGRADSDHYHEILAKTLVAHEIAKSVQRHKHLIPDIKAALDALDAVAKRTIHDAYWTATDEEMQAIETGAEITRALMCATHGPAIRRAMGRVLRMIDQRKKETT